MRAHVSLAPTLLLVFVACASPSRRMSPFDYNVVVEDRSGAADQGRTAELLRCISLWDIARLERTSVFDWISRRGALGKPGTVLMEVGNAGFGRYGYALVVDGRCQSATEASVEPIDTGLEALLRASAAEHGPRLENDTVSPVDDGDCYFLTLVAQDGSIRQVAVYGTPREQTLSGRLVRLLLPYVHEQRRQ